MTVGRETVEFLDDLPAGPPGTGPRGDRAARAGRGRARPPDPRAARGRRPRRDGERRGCLAAGAGIWSAVGVGSACWAASNPGSATLDCFDGASVTVGRMSVGDSGAGVRGPVVTTARAVHAVTVRDQSARGSHASCGVAPRASTGGRRGD